jgi:4-amino-4-deoxy-L-arabinose transferase-like glycosyltransferase
VALAALIAAALFVGLGSAVPLGTHEGLLAETARNMVLDRPVTLADGSQPSPWLIPNFDGVMRLRKTPLPYWVAAACAKVAGEVNEWAVRLPSALAGAGTAVLVALLAWRRHGRTSALLAAAALVTMAEFILVSRRAIADMGLVFWTTGCLAALWTAVERRGAARAAWLALAGALGGVAMMAKGPTPLVILPVPALVATAIMLRRLRNVKRAGASAPGDRAWTLGGLAAGSVLFLAVTVPWYLYVYLCIPDAWRIWQAESVDRAMGDFGHGEPIYFYLIRLPVLMLPWTFFVAYGMVLAIKRVRGTNVNNTRPASGAASEATDAKAWLVYLGAWLAGPLVALSVFSGKQDHYILPIFPAAALYVALAIEHLLTSPGGAKAGRWTIVVHGVAFALAGVVAIVYVAREMPDFEHPAAVLMKILIAGGILAIPLALRWGLPVGMATLLAAVVAAFAWSAPTLIGPLDRSVTDATFGRKVNELTPADAAVLSVRGVNGTVVFYADRRIDIVNSTREIRARMAQAAPFYLIALDKDAGEVQIPEGLKVVYHEESRRNPSLSKTLYVWPGQTGS